MRRRRREEGLREGERGKRGGGETRKGRGGGRGKGRKKGKGGRGGGRERGKEVDVFEWREGGGGGGLSRKEGWGGGGIEREEGRVRKVRPIDPTGYETSFAFITRVNGALMTRV